MKNAPLPLVLLLAACGGDDPLLAPPDTGAQSRPTPLCAAGGAAPLAESAGDLGAPSVLALDDGLVGVFAANNQFDSGLFFFRADRRGKLDPIKRVPIPAAAPLSAPALASSGSGFGLAWEDRRDAENGRDPEIYFAPLNNEGGLQSASEIRISRTAGESTQPTLAFGGDSFLLAWADAGDDASARCRNKGECLHSIYLARLSLTGALIGEPQRLSPPDHDAISPSLLFTGGGFLLSYSDTAGDSSPECAANRGDCQYQTSLHALDREGKVLKTSALKNLMDAQLVPEPVGDGAFLVGWAEGVLVAKVSSAGDATELSRSVVPVRGVPQLSLAPAREGFWLAVSDSPASRPPGEFYSNDLWVYRLGPDGTPREVSGFPVSQTETRSERPVIFPAGAEDALILWREARPALYASCQERPQNCVADLYLSVVTCGDGVAPPTPRPPFEPMLSQPGALFRPNPK